MLWKNTSTQFGHISILIHWLVALSVYGMFALGLWMVSLNYYDAWYHKAPEIHKSIGFVLFLLMIFRVLWRFISPPPKALDSYSNLVKISSILVQISLYLLLFGIFLSGYLISTADGQPISIFGYFEIPAIWSDEGIQADSAGVVHLYLAWILIILSILHALAALKHHFIDRDVTLKRILGIRSRN